MTQELAAVPIVVEAIEIEGDSDLYGLITVTSADSTAIEVQCTFDELLVLGRQIRSVERAILWHRAEWLYTLDWGATHLARKNDRKILCGQKRETWEFAPHFADYHHRNVCKRCQRIFEKAAAR